MNEAFARWLTAQSRFSSLSSVCVRACVRRSDPRQFVYTRQQLEEGKCVRVMLNS